MATSTPTDATLIRLRERLAAADMDDVRRALLMLSERVDRTTNSGSAQPPLHVWFEAFVACADRRTGAYQHYGDPSFSFAASQEERRDTASAAAPRGGKQSQRRKS